MAESRTRFQEGIAMTLQEKSALAGLVTVQLVYGSWFAGWLPLSAFAVVMAHFILLALVQLVIAGRHGHESADERDRRIANEAATVAFFVALGGIAFNIAMLGLGVPPAKLALTLMAAFALADMTRYGAQILGYRSV